VDAPTDVLSFPQDPDYATSAWQGRVPAGDVVISLQTLGRNARIRKIGEEEELKRLLIHGILHLEGMDHEEENSEMIRLQEHLLKRMEKERIF
jgi:probable rRNA maturation factor